MHQIVNFTKGVSKKILLVIFLLAGLNAEAQFRVYSYNNTNDNKTSIKYSKSGFDKFVLKYEGEITLSDDDKDVVAISDGGYLEIKKSVFGSKRKVVIESDAHGRLLKKYYTGFSQKAFEPEGRKWLAEMLPDIVRIEFAQRVNNAGDSVKQAYRNACKSISSDSYYRQATNAIGN